MIKSIISDIGGVLTVWNNLPLLEDIKNTFAITDAQTKTVYEELIPLLGTGSISESEFWKRFIAKVNTKKKLPKESLYLREYAKQVKINNVVLDIFRQLKSLGYKLAALSNSYRPHTLFNRRSGFYDAFDLTILSDEVGLIKPGPEIYRLTLKKLKISPHEAIFIDDFGDNIKTAKNLGMHVILYINPQDLKNKLREFGVKI